MTGRAVRFCRGACRQGRSSFLARCPRPTAVTRLPAQSLSNASMRRRARRPLSTSCCALRIRAVVFMDVSHISQQQEQKDGSEKDVSPTGTGFDVKRFYLSVDHQFNDIWSADLTTDAQFSSSTTAGSGGVAEVFIKKLYLQAKINDAFVVHAGAYTTPWAPFVESLYGYRWVEKTATDRLGFANTADWGLNASGKIADNVVSYSASVLNGGGYKNPTRTKDVDFEGRVGVSPVSWLTLGAGYYTGHLGQITTANE